MKELVEETQLLWPLDGKSCFTALLLGYVSLRNLVNGRRTFLFFTFSVLPHTVRSIVQVSEVEWQQHKRTPYRDTQRCER